MYIEAPDDLPAPQRERWAHGIELLRDLSRSGDLRRGRLVAYGVDDFWELVVRREDQMFKVDGPEKRPPTAADGRSTFDLTLEFDELSWGLLQELADEEIAGAHLRVPAMHIDGTRCRSASTGEPIRVHLTVGVIERDD